MLVVSRSRFHIDLSGMGDSPYQSPIQQMPSQLLGDLLRNAATAGPLRTDACDLSTKLA